MRKIRILAALAAFCTVGLAADAVTTTTLVQAVTSTASDTIYVASSTGITARTRAQARGGVGNSTANNLTLLLIDREVVEVEYVGVAVLAPTTAYPIRVHRGAQGTSPAKHLASAKVWVGRAGIFDAIDRSGACSTTAEPVLPVFNIRSGKRFNCIDTNWYDESTPAATIQAFCTGTLGDGETDFLNGVACDGATAATARYVVSTAGAIANLQVYSSAAAVGGTGKDVVTVLKNGSNTTLTCTIAASGTTCSDLSNKVAVAAGDVLTFKIVTASSDTGANLSVAVEKYQAQ